MFRDTTYGRSAEAEYEAGRQAYEAARNDWEGDREETDA